MSRSLPQLFDPVSVPREATQALLPQRPPLLLVDAICGLGRGPQPALRASYRISRDEPVLAGHFPGRPIWPGSYTIEGLAQSCALLSGILSAHALGRAPLAVPAAWVEGAEAVSAADPLSPLLCAIDVKLLHPVTPPAELVYEVVLTHVVGAICRFEVTALCEHRVVAHGALSVAAGQGPQ